MQYQVVVPTRDILLGMKSAWPVLAALPGWVHYLDGYLPHVNSDVDTSIVAIDQYLSEMFEIDDSPETPPPLDERGRWILASVMSSVMGRIMEHRDRIFLPIPNGFVHSAEIIGWAGLDILLVFHFTHVSYTVPEKYARGASV